MCIAFPGRVISIDENNYATLDIGGTRREASLDIIDQDVAIGDYVICHAGFAIHRVDEESAREKLELLQRLLEENSH